MRDVDAPNQEQEQANAQAHAQGTQAQEPERAREQARAQAIDAAHLASELTAKLKALYDERYKLNQRIRKLEREADGIAYPTYACLRCGYAWQGRMSARPPRHCARCHSSSWDVPPEELRGLRRLRQPSDPPNPHWKKRRAQVLRDTHGEQRSVERFGTRESHVYPDLPPPPGTRTSTPVTIVSEAPRVPLIYEKDEAQPERVLNPRRMDGDA